MFGNCLTQEEEVHRTQEAEGKAYPVGILGDGSQEVDLAFLVEQMASGPSQRQVDPLSQKGEKDASEQRSFPIESFKGVDTYQEASFPFRAQLACRDLVPQEAKRHEKAIVVVRNSKKKKRTHSILLVVVLHWRRTLYGQ